MHNTRVAVVAGKALSKLCVMGMVLLQALILGENQARAAMWTGATDGNWNTPGNWTNNVLPSLTEAAIFTNTVNTTISLNGANRSVKSMLFDTGTGSFTFNASGTEKLVLAGGTLNIQLPNTATGTGLSETFNCPISLSGNFAFNNARADTTSSLIFNGPITNSATSLLTLSGAGTGTNRINSIISDGGGVQSIAFTASAGAWVLGGANTFSGNVTLSGAGTLILSGNSSAGGDISMSNGTLLLSGTNTSSGTTSISGGTIVLASGANGGLARGTLSFSGTGNPYVRSSDSTSRTITNALSLGRSSQIFLGDLTATGPLVMTGNAVLTTNALIAAKSVVAFEGVISGSYGFSRNDGGTLFLLGANTFGGIPSIGSATVSTTVLNQLGLAGAASSLGTNGTITVAPCSVGQSGATPTLRYVGSSSTCDRTFDVTGNGTTLNVTMDSSGSGPLILSGNILQSGTTGTTTRAVYLSGVNTGDNIFSGTTADGVPFGSTPTLSRTSLQKSGCGTWSVSGANLFTDGLKVNSGNLILDYAINATVVSNANTLTLGGGSLQFKGKSSGSTSQTLGNVIVSANSGLSTVSLSKNGGSGVALTNGTITLNSLSALLYDLGADAADTVTVGSTLSTVNYARCLIKDGTGRFDWAVNTAANTPVTALNSTTDLIANPSAADYRLTGDFTVTNNTNQAKSLRIEPGTDNRTLTLTQNTPSGNNRISGIMLVGDKNFTINQTAGQTGGLGDNTSAATKALIYHFGTGKLTLNVLLAGNNAGAGNGTIEFCGTGLIDWTKAPNSSGNVLIGGVTLRQGGSTGQLLSNAGSGLGSGNIILAQKGVLEVSDATDITRNVGSVAGAIQWVGDGGFSAFGGTRNVKLNNGTASITWGSTSFVGLNNALVLSSASSDGTIDFQNGLDFANGQRVVDTRNGSAEIDAKLSGVLSGSYGSGLIKRGAGTLELTGANTYSGDTWVEAGTLRVSGTAGNGIVTVSSGASVSGTGTVNRLTLNSGGKLAVYDTGSGVGSKLNVTGAMNISNGTLDLSSLPTLADGDLTVANCGSIVGSSFSSVVGLPANREVQVVGNTIVLKDTTAQGFMLIVR